MPQKCKGTLIWPVVVIYYKHPNRGKINFHAKDDRLRPTLGYKYLAVDPRSRFCGAPVEGYRLPSWGLLLAMK